MASEEQFTRAPALEEQPQIPLEERHRRLFKHSTLPMIATNKNSDNNVPPSRNSKVQSNEDEGSEYFMIKVDQSQNSEPIEPRVGKLHRMNVTYLEAKILLHHKILFAEGEEQEQFKSLCTISRWNDLTNDLAAYTKAIQNYRYWANSSVDFTENLGSSSLVRQLLAIELNESPDQPATPLTIDNATRFEFRRETMEEKTARVSKEMDERVRERKHKRRQRLREAVLGGGALIVPMLIMTLHKTLLTTLLTASLAILMVGVALALLWKTAKPQEVIGATAAYAAVLVVMVGTGGT